MFKVFKERRSLRRYIDKNVETDKIEQGLKAARLSPSWNNLQCWRFLVIDNRWESKHNDQG
ncbi:MAG: nitroreductase family protein [Desulfuromonadales bacterium]|nr:nitroreductase family protein [Desulfuromonadales bacterium]